MLLITKQSELQANFLNQACSHRLKDTYSLTMSVFVIL